MNTYSGVSGSIPFTRLKLKDFSLSFLYLLESNGRLSEIVQKNPKRKLSLDFLLLTETLRIDSKRIPGRSGIIDKLPHNFSISRTYRMKQINRTLMHFAV